MTRELKLGFLGAGLLHVILLTAFGWVSAPSYAVSVSPQILEVSLIRRAPVGQKDKAERFLKTPIVSVEAQEKIHKTTEKSKPQTASAPPQMEALIQGAFKNSEPRKEINEAPYYPRKARRNGHEGKVLLKVSVNEKGSVENLKILKSSGHDELDKSAANTIRKWVFNSACLFGKPVRSEIEIPVVFKLEKQQ